MKRLVIFLIFPFLSEGMESKKLNKKERYGKKKVWQVKTKNKSELSSDSFKFDDFFLSEMLQKEEFFGKQRLPVFQKKPSGY
jgi:hypothetical protein